MMDNSRNPPSIVQAGLKGLCPRCGAASLFDGPIRFAASCRSCALDYGAFNVGDGPAALLTLGVGAMVCAGAIIFELTVHPPWWLHALLWFPITLVLVLSALRVCKGMLLASEYGARVEKPQVAD